MMLASVRETILEGYRRSVREDRRRAERRSEDRLQIDEPAVLHVLRTTTVLGSKGGGRIPVRVMDVSRQGLGLKSEEQLPSGALIRIRISDTVVAIGEIRYSKEISDGFYSGVLVSYCEDVRTQQTLDS